MRKTINFFVLLLMLGGMVAYELEGQVSIAACFFWMATILLITNQAA